VANLQGHHRLSSAGVAGLNGMSKPQARTLAVAGTSGSKWWVKIIICIFYIFIQYQNMANIEKFSPLKLKRIGYSLTEIFFQDLSSNDNCIQLIVTVESQNINIKQFSRYLDLIYRIDGMLSEIGYARYVQTPNSQIEISDVQFGSIELWIERFINSIDANNLVIIGLCLKYLPKMIKIPLEAGKQYYELLNEREDYLEKKEKRKAKSNLRQAINQDDDLIGVPRSLKEKLLNLMIELYDKNKKYINSSSRFIYKSVKSVDLKTKKKHNK
jgi:hypothetical protein